MGVPADRLPDHFPVGTRYVVEGRGGGQGRFRVQSRYLEFPDGRQISLPLDRVEENSERVRRRLRSARK